MKLDPKEFKRFKELLAKSKANKCTDAEKAELEELTAKRNEKGSNAPKWWLNYPKLAQDVTNIAFNVIPGTSQTLDDPTVPGQIPVQLGTIAVAIINPAIGKSVSDADAFNTQIRRLWLDMHRRYRGIGSYEKSDLGIMLIAINQAFSLLSKFERQYGVINAYKVANRAVPYGLMEALHISTDAEQHLADFRYVLNLYAKKMQQFCLPKGLSILESDIIMLSNVFKDSENVRASMFAFDTKVFGIYNPTRFTSGGCVDFKSLQSEANGVTRNGGYAFTVSDIARLLEMVTSALLSDDDVAKMCSDLIAAYGDNNVQTISEIPDNYFIEPIHDYERLVQFHNLTMVGEVLGVFDLTLEVGPNTPITDTYVNALYTSDYKYCIYQLNNAVICKLSGNQGPTQFAVHDGHIQMGNTSVQGTDYPGVVTEAIIDYWVDNPSVDDILIGTRLTSMSEDIQTDGTVYWQQLTAFGSQVVSEVEVYAFDATVRAWVSDSISSTIDHSGAYYETAQSMLNQIDWRPLTYFVSGAAYYIVGDLDNWTRLTSRNLSRIHEVCLLSGYFIPAVAKAD